MSFRQENKDNVLIMNNDSKSFLNCTMLNVAFGNKIINIETFILNSNNTYNTYKRGMSDSFTNTMGPFLPIQMIYFFHMCHT